MPLATPTVPFVDGSPRGQATQAFAQALCSALVADGMGEVVAREVTQRLAQRPCVFNALATVPAGLSKEARCLAEIVAGITRHDGLYAELARGVRAADRLEAARSVQLDGAEALRQELSSFAG